MIEQHIKVNGEDSWRDVYTTPVMELLAKSNYEEFLEKIDKE